LHKYLLLLLLLPSIVYADEYAPFFSWTPSTTFAGSGAPLDVATQVAEFRMYCDEPVSGGPITLPNTDNTWQAPFGFFEPGTYTCRMTQVLIASLGSGESLPSTDVTFTVDPDRPSPIVIFEVN